MHRRDCLATLAAAAVGGLSAPEAATRRPDDGGSRGARLSPNASRPAADPELPVPESDLVRAAPTDAIPAIVDPVFGSDWSDLEAVNSSLAGGDEVLGVVRDGRPRAYPLKLLDRHEVVNDHLGGPLLVTYCPVCRSGVVAERRVAGAVRTFGVSGHLYRANLVLYDEESGSHWSQLLATAIRGPLTGTELALLPSRTTAWREWRGEYPETEVLRPPPESGTVVGPTAINYDLDVYGRHRTIAERYPDHGPLGDLEWSDTRLRRRTVVIGIATDGAARAYPRREVEWNEPINDIVGDVPVVVALADGTLVAYDRRVDGGTLRVEADDGALAGGGSRWDPLTGQATEGPHAGRTLRDVAPVGGLYWAAWLKVRPETEVYGRGGG